MSLDNANLFLPTVTRNSRNVRKGSHARFICCGYIKANEASVNVTKYPKFMFTTKRKS